MESELQKQCNAYLRKRGILFYHQEKGRGGQRQSKMHSGGLPDLLIWHKNKHIAIELKTKTGKQKLNQIDFQIKYEKEGFQYFLVDNCLFFKEIIDVIFLGKRF